MRPLDLDLLDDVQELYARYGREKVVELRVRWHALWLISQGQTEREEARVLGVDERAVRRWVSWYVWLDGGYNGKSKGKDWIETVLGRAVEIVHHPRKIHHTWAPVDAVIDWEKLLPLPWIRVLPRRWAVERTFSWLGQSRRLSKDYERLCETSEALIKVVMIGIMVRQLAAS